MSLEVSSPVFNFEQEADKAIAFTWPGTYKEEGDCNFAEDFEGFGTSPGSIGTSVEQPLSFDYRFSKQLFRQDCDKIVQKLASERLYIWDDTEGDCNQRAICMTQELIKNMHIPSERILQQAVIGNLEHPYQDFLGDGIHKWQFHVAPFLCAQEGFFVIDPAVDAAKALKRSEWVEKLCPGIDSSLQLTSMSLAAGNVYQISANECSIVHMPSDLLFRPCSQELAFQKIQKQRFAQIPTSLIKKACSRADISNKEYVMFQVNICGQEEIQEAYKRLEEKSFGIYHFDLETDQENEEGASSSAAPPAKRSRQV